MTKHLLSLVIAGALLSPAAATQAAVVISGNFCSSAPVANLTPGTDLDGDGNIVASGAGLGSGNIGVSGMTGAGGWFNDLTDTGPISGFPQGYSYTSNASASGAGAVPAPGPTPPTFGGTTAGANLYYNDGTGVSSGFQVAWSADRQDANDFRNTAGGYFNVTDRNDELMAGFLYSGGAPTFASTITLSMTGLDTTKIDPTKGYDVYIYIDGESFSSTAETGGYSARMIAGATDVTYYGIDSTDYLYSGGAPGVTTPAGSFVRATGTSEGAATPYATYVLFEGLTSDSFSFTLSGLFGTGLNRYFDVAMNGFEIVQVPTPATLALFGLGLAGLAAARRRAR